ncbi:hypothetical protein EMCRGX_G030920 [Ephydatia muelleri]
MAVSRSSQRRKSRRGSRSPEPQKTTVVQEEPENKLEGKSRPDRPIHRVRDSLFSSASGFQNYRGLLNDCILLLVLSNARNVISNVLKYGLLVNPLQWGRLAVGLNNVPSYWLLLGSSVFVLITLKLEQAAAKGLVSQGVLLTMHTINLVTLLTTPVVIVFTFDAGLVGRFCALGWYTVLFMKLVSYIQVNSWCRTMLKNIKTGCAKSDGVGAKSYGVSAKSYGVSAKSDGVSAKSDGVSAKMMVSVPRVMVSVQRVMVSVPKSDGVSDNSDGVSAKSDGVGENTHGLVLYPNNLNVQDMVYYLAAPTLCYELNFPRIPRIRKVFLLRRTLEAVFLFNVVLAIVQQWLVPTALNSLKPFKEMDYLLMVERVLILAGPNHLMWLLTFYFFFHSYMNILGELLRFGDRQFYKDWWNADTIRRFWSSWNIPVHQFALRHVYTPIVELGYSQTVAVTTVFLLSAFFHEYVVSISLRMVRTWSFVAMVSQVPLGILTSLSFMRGQFYLPQMPLWLSEPENHFVFEFVGCRIFLSELF